MKIGRCCRIFGLVAATCTRRGSALAFVVCCRCRLVPRTSCLSLSFLYAIFTVCTSLCFVRPAIYSFVIGFSDVFHDVVFCDTRHTCRLTTD
jgi:hypothetical protein